MPCKVGYQKKWIFPRTLSKLSEKVYCCSMLISWLYVELINTNVCDLTKTMSLIPYKYQILLIVIVL